MKKAIGRLMRCRALQPLWARLHHASLIGMNYWATSIEDSGELALLERMAPRLAHATIFDVGANRGQWANAARARCPTATIHSFEPSRHAFADLMKVEGITPHRLALSDREGQQTLHTAEAGATIGSLIPLRHPIRPFTGEHDEEVAVSTIDLFCEREGISHIDFLKIDVEGAELAVLRGASAMLARGAIGLIQFEFGDGHLDARSSLRDFFDLLDGYRFSRIVPGGLVAIERYSPELEIYAPVNFLASRADLD